MTLAQVKTHLDNGVLKGLSIKTDPEAVVSYINLALIELYGRYSLKASEFIVPLQDNIVDYTLPSDLIYIQAVYDEDGDEFSLDDETNRFGVFQTSFNNLQVANPNTGATIGVMYVAAPEYIVYIDETTMEETIQIPPQLLSPLLLYVGYMAHVSEDAAADQEHNVHYVRYEAACNKVEQLGLIRRAVPPAHINMKEGISEIEPTYEIVNN